MLMRSAQPFSGSRQRGIALLLTIVLLVFLVLIMVAMSSLVRVETQISINTQSLAQARQNAMFGLNTAIGKLQETAGPDQRVTARADLVVAAGKPQVNLTGVWDTSAGAPNLITWLVNGNEDPLNPLEVKPDALVTAESNSSSTMMDATDTAGDHPLVDSLYDDSAPKAHAFPSGLRFGDGHVYLVAGGSVDLKTTVGYKGNAATGSVSKSERVILRKSPIIIDGDKVAGKAPGNPVTVGNYAFWVSDDGIKASLGTGNRSPLVKYDDSPVGDGLNYLPAANAANDQAYINRKMLNNLQLQGPRLDLVLRDYSASDIFSPARVDFYGVIAHPQTENLRNELSTSSQLEYGIYERPFANPTLTIPALAASLATYKDFIHDRLKQNFHDVTPHTYSVLTNMLTGDLKGDLSQQLELDALAPVEFQNAVKSFVDAWRPSVGISVPFSTTTKTGLLQQVVAITPPAASAFVAGKSAFPIVPSISEFEFFLGLTAVTDGSGTAANVMATPSIRLELWNSYNAIMKVKGLEKLYIELPLIDAAGSELLASPDIDDGAVTASLSVAYTLGWNGSDKPWAATFELTAANPGNWKPGEIKLWNATPTAGNAKNTGGDNITGFAAGSSDFNVVVASSKLDINLLMGPDVANAKKLYGVSAVEFEDINSKTAVDGLNYYFRLRDTDNNANSNWLNKIDPRGPQLAYSASNFATLNLNALQQFDAVANYLLRNDTHSSPAQVALFDIPRQEVLGVGAFQHLVYSVGGASYKIGSSSAGAGNGLFDQYFFSSVPRAGGTWNPKVGDVMANTSMVVFDPAVHSDTTKAALKTALQSQNSPEYLLLRDAFNINSTSIAAWRSILGGALPTLADPAATLVADQDDYVWDGTAGVVQMKANWRYFDGTTDKTEPVRNVFFRLPQTATNIGADYLSLRGDLTGNNKTNQRTATYRVGLRELTKEQVDGMAGDVVKHLKLLAKPFASVKEFIDAGILQNAIDSQVSINEPTLTVPIPKYSPGYLTQADILQLIGHRLVARSDTFTIRAYGDVVNPVSGAVEARAWVEATVQRTPVKHPTSATPGNNMKTTGSAAGNFGRQFKVISMRWLGSDEI
ncbi:hypothetical protein IMCC26134_00775 [Verrucomicrobia bacterium IMCC26134]|nr:hypothetical protein IMCC26134_00775 [Verrucomicrobia bacterium IMCC26134]